MGLLWAVAVGRPTSCRQTVPVSLVSCYPKRKSDSRVRSWEIWPIFLDDFFFPIPVFCCGIWLWEQTLARAVPRMVSIVMWVTRQREWVGPWTVCGFGAETGCVCRCVWVLTFWKVRRRLFWGTSGILGRPSFSSNGLFSFNTCLFNIHLLRGAGNIMGTPTI